MKNIVCRCTVCWENWLLLHLYEHWVCDCWMCTVCIWAYRKQYQRNWLTPNYGCNVLAAGLDIATFSDWKRSERVYYWNAGLVMNKHQTYHYQWLILYIQAIKSNWSDHKQYQSNCLTSLQYISSRIRHQGWSHLRGPVGPAPPRFGLDKG